MDTKQIDKKKNAKNDSDAIQRRKERRANRNTGVNTDWHTVDSDLILNLIAAITAIKGTITFGYTRDGGAYYLNYYIDGESYKEYIRPTENIDRFLEGEIEFWKNS